MKNILTICAFIVLQSSCSQSENKAVNVKSIELNSEWQFRKSNDTMWLSATIPGTVHTDLLDNGIIEDPYYRTNEKNLQWIDKEDWEYRCNFTIDDDLLQNDKVELLFEGLDTYADVFLNDQLVLQADNMFREWRISCKDLLEKGPNELRIVLKSPTKIGLEKLKVNGYPLPASNDQSENGEMGENKVSIFTRKAGYHFGWDWGPRLVTSGIWRPVKLVAFNTAKITDIHFEQKVLEPEKVRFIAKCQIETIKDFSGIIEILSEDLSIKVKDVEFKKGRHIYDVKFDIENPKLWWPNGSGEAHLYNIKVKLLQQNSKQNPLLDQLENNIGVRTIKLVQAKDKTGDGESFFFEVNGRSVFAKGANYIPNDVFLTRFTPDDYERIVKDAAEANMNMLRIWGGGIYEDDLFYDLCDKYGIMVWQDFMYACSMYPGDDKFLENARIEAEENIKRLRNHPSLALWCGNNEIEVAWAEYKEGSGWGWKERYNDDQRKEIWNNYDTLFHHILPAAVAEFNPEINYWHSSPSAGMGKLASYETNSGDMHYWGVWHGQHPFSDFRKYKSRFMSEYGFQSFPELNTVAKYALPEEWDIESEVMAAHQRSGIGNLRIKQYMEDDYIIPDDFNHFLYVSQLLQAESIKMAIESHRAEMPYCMGTLYWQLNDCWPVASWAGIDYFGRWKALHYFVKKAFEETIVTTFQENDNISIWIVNDGVENSTTNLSIKLIDFEGNLIWQQKDDIQIGENVSFSAQSINLGTLAKFGDFSKVLLVTSLKDEQGLISESKHYFTEPKNLELMDPGLELEVTEKEDVFEISLEANRLAKNVFLSTDLSTDHFSDNYFDVLPGTIMVVEFPKTADLSSFNNSLKLVHLFETINN